MSPFSWFLLFVLAIICHGVAGETEKDFDFYMKLKHLRKSAIKTVKTEVGDVYDCIDIHKQPSLDHPLLRNHKIQMSPTSRPKQMYRKTLSSNAQRANLITVNCPKGTVPIRRLEEQDLARAKNFSESYLTKMHPQTARTPGAHFAIYQSSKSFTGPVVAIKGTASLHSLPDIKPTQTSSAHMWMGRHDDNLQTGWMVSPHLNGDTLTRLFGYFKSRTHGGCFNLQCGGFIQVNREIPIDIAIKETSTYDGEIYEITILIFKDEKTNCWWVGTNDDENIGYWPSGLLQDLDKDGASDIAWGGLVTGPIDASPAMGNGHYEETNDFKKTAFFTQLKIWGSSNKWVDMKSDDLERFNDCRDLYSLQLYKWDPTDGLAFSYGGPGGNCGKMIDASVNAMS